MGGVRSLFGSFGMWFASNLSSVCEPAENNLQVVEMFVSRRSQSAILLKRTGRLSWLPLGFFGYGSTSTGGFSNKKWQRTSTRHPLGVDLWLERGWGAS